MAHSELERVDEIYSGGCVPCRGSALAERWRAAELIARLWTLHGAPRPYGCPNELVKAGRTIYVLRHPATGLLLAVAAGKAGPLVTCRPTAPGPLPTAASPERLLLSLLLDAEPGIEAPASCSPVLERLVAELAAVSLSDWSRCYWDDRADQVTELRLSPQRRWQRRPARRREAVEFLRGILASEALEPAAVALWRARLAAVPPDAAG